MTSERIKEIQQQTTYPDSISVQQALLQVWNECSRLPQQEILDEYTTIINAIRQGTGMSIKDSKRALLDVREDIVELCRQWYRKNGKKF
jgi:hypothetical protein